MNSVKFWQIDSFTDTIFKGNPAAVFVFDEFPSDALMQNIAMEMNLSETAFVETKNGFKIRWMTPTSEVDLCGHGTLAAAHVLWSNEFATENVIELQSNSGILGVEKSQNGYVLDFPSQPPNQRDDLLSVVSEALGCSPLYVGANDHDLMAVVESSDLVENYHPDLTAIANLRSRGFLVTARGNDTQFDYVYRAFFPNEGIDEDPVTGSANTILAPYWSKELGIESLKAAQLSRRGGILGLQCQGERIKISGQCVDVFAGVFNLRA